MPKPSAQIRGLKGQPMFQILTRCRLLEKSGVRVRHFELGDPAFDTPAPIVEAAVKSLYDGNTHYQPSRGDLSLLEAVQHTTLTSRHFTPETSQISVTTGANAGIFYALKAICDAGDDVLLPDPYFPTYIAACHLADVRTNFYPLTTEEGFLPEPRQLDGLVTAKTKAILINSPSNPTGAVFSEDLIRQLYDFALRHDLYIISDEVYARMIFDKEVGFYSPSSIDQCLQRTILINGFSKAFAMTGWRIGVVIAPVDVSEKITLISESIVSCVPGFVQEAAKAALVASSETTDSMYTAYRARQLRLCEEFRTVGGFECAAPQGAMYVFPSVGELTNSSEHFAFHLLDSVGVATVPGVYFGSQGERHLRFSCAGSDENIEGLNDLLNEAVESYGSLKK
jgi:aspartate/methionine/tyrosine aminotransferase